MHSANIKDIAIYKEEIYTLIGILNKELLIFIIYNQFEDRFITYCLYGQIWQTILTKQLITFNRKCQILHLKFLDEALLGLIKIT